MQFYEHPEPFIQLRNFYWSLRNVRHYDTAARRKWYRRIEKERGRLADIGFSCEHVRLYCRYMSNPVPQSPALRRLETFEAMLAEFARIQRAARGVSVHAVAEIALPVQ
jgi:hypothetical protein